MLLALVVLYSLYIEGNVVSGEQLKLFYYAIFKEFDRILKLVVRRSSLEFIKRHYQTEHIYKMEDRNNLHKLLRKKRDGKRVRLPFQYAHFQRYSISGHRWLVNISQPRML